MIEDTIKKFKTVESNLIKKAWFKKGKWLISVHGFPAKKPEFVTFHIFKENWFNEDKKGIHIESFLAIDPKKRKKSYITLHILHHAIIPGTKLKRALISRPFVDEVFDEVSSWDGYKFRVGKYGTQPFTKVLDGTAPDFEKNLETEASRICQKLGPIIDRLIKETI